MNYQLKNKPIFWSIAVIGGVLFVLFLALVFSGKLILPQAIPLGPFRLRFYGLILAAAAVVGYWLAAKRAPNYGVDQNQMDTLLLIAFAGGFIGARIYHILTALGYYRTYPTEIIAVWHGGLSIFGAIIFGSLSVIAYLYFTKSRLSIWKVLDWLAPSVVVGQAIGRFGNLFNYEVYGYPTNLPWKMFVPTQFRLPPYELSAYFHPLFLYEVIGCAIITYVLIRISKKVPTGGVFLWWLLMYNGMRFFVEMLRIENVFIAGFRLNILVSGALVIISAALLRKLYAVQNSHAD